MKAASVQHPPRVPQLLLVEDDVTLQKVLASFLTDTGAEVTCAGSLAEGRAHAERRTFDATVLDVGLPDGNGLDLLEITNPDRVLVISANPYRPAYAECGVRHFLEKPLDLDDLAEALDRLLPEAARGLGRETAQGESLGQSGPRIAIYSHDTMGLGHLRRNLLIAQALSAPPIEANVLMIAGVLEARCYRAMPRVDSLTLPALQKSTDGTYSPRQLGSSLSDVIRLRSKVIRTALEEFDPALLIVDNVPRGAVRELEPALRALRSRGRTRCVLGLRDIADDPDSVHREWQLAMNDDAIRQYYDHIWVYGDREVYDRIREDQLSPDIAAKARYVGYLDQRARLETADARAAVEVALHGLDPGAPILLCMLGGGQDGQRLAEAFAAADFPAGATGVILTGPYLPRAEQERLSGLARQRSELRVIEFLSEPTLLVERADRIISMGGYNTVLELVSFGKRGLIVPRVVPRREQLIRAELFSKMGLLDTLHPDDLSPDALSKWLSQAGTSEPPRLDRIDLNALERLPGLVAGLLPAGSSLVEPAAARAKPS